MDAWESSDPTGLAVHRNLGAGELIAGRGRSCRNCLAAVAGHESASLAFGSDHANDSISLEKNRKSVCFFANRGDLIDILEESMT